MTWVPPGEFARIAGIDDSTQRKRHAKNPRAYKRNEFGWYWVDDEEGAPESRATGTPVKYVRSVAQASDAGVSGWDEPTVEMPAPTDIRKREPLLRTSPEHVQPTSTSTDLERWVIIPDTHVPYHDRDALALVLRAAKALEIHNVALLGDFADFWCVSSHPKPPGRRKDLRYEIDEVSAALKLIEQAFDGRRLYVMGNHEWRLERFLTQHAPELFHSVTIEGELGLRERGWEVTPYKSDARIGKLALTHDVGRTGMNAHRDAMNAYQGNVAIGHTHRLAWCVEGNVKGEAHVGVMLGWLGDREQVDYMHRARAARDWALGFGLAYREVDTDHVHVVPVPIVAGKVCVEGRLIR
jgi:hypothetical protein